MTYTIASVIDAVAANPGTSAGIPVESLRAIWRSMCHHISSMLERRRSVMIPDFAHFVVQKHVGHSGTWGARVTWVPCIALLPIFCQSYGLPLNTQTSLMHQGATTPVSINGTAIVAHASAPVSRHGVMNAVKDFVREIGALARLASGRPLTLDMGFCKLHFSNRALANIQWSPDFLRSLNSDEHVAATVSAGLAPKELPPALAAAMARSRSSTPRSSSRAGTPRAGTPRREAERDDMFAHMAADPAFADAVARAANRASASAGDASSKSKQQLVPRPPPKSSANEGGPAESEPSAPLVQPPHSNSNHNNDNGDGDARAAGLSESTGAAAAGGSGGSVSAAISPRRALTQSHLADALRQVDEADASPHKKRMARKLAYRRSRNQAYEDAWEKSLAAKSAAAERERAADRRNADAVLAHQLEDAARAQREAAEKRAEEQRVLTINKELAERRRGQGLPRAHSPGDIFDARRTTDKAPHDVSTLNRQIAERREREERAKAEAAAFGEAAWHEYVEHQAEEARRKAEHKAEREQANRDYAKIVEDKRQQAKQEAERELALARKCTGFQGFGLGADAFKAQSIAIQKANYELMRERALERQQQEQEEKARLAETIKRIELRDAALRDQEKRVKSARQARMRETWKAQMSERDLAKQEERRQRQEWKDVNFLRNESSDDEDDHREDRVYRVPNTRPMVARPRPPSSSPRVHAPM